MFDSPGLHIVAAHHTVGSSITLLNILRARALGEPVFGVQSASPARIGHLTPRGMPNDGAREFFARHEVECWEIASTKTTTEAADELVKAIRAQEQDDSVIVVGVDPAVLITESCSPNNAADVGATLTVFSRLGQRERVCFVFSHFLAKQYQRDSPLAARIAGCSLWSSAMRTKTVIEAPSADPLARNRRIIYYPETGSPLAWDCVIGDDGIMTTAEQSDAELFLAAIAPGDTFTTADIVTVFELSDGPRHRNSANNWIKKALAENRIVRVQQGTYRKRAMI